MRNYIFQLILWRWIADFLGAKRPLHRSVRRQYVRAFSVCIYVRLSDMTVSLYPFGALKRSPGVLMREHWYNQYIPSLQFSMSSSLLLGTSTCNIVRIFVCAHLQRYLTIKNLRHLLCLIIRHHSDNQLSCYLTTTLEASSLTGPKVLRYEALSLFSLFLSSNMKKNGLLDISGARLCAQERAARILLAWCALIVVTSLCSGESCCEDDGWCVRQMDVRKQTCTK